MASVIRRWAMISLAVLLIIFILNLARIPLTVFAFLGGALAIGIGFGTQTIIKNVISGIIILFERKIRVGDIIALGGMTGHVVAVDLRASTVRGFDGVEALVPNSSFLENQVVNWTYSNPRIRREVRIGVAYGSPVRRPPKSSPAAPTITAGPEGPTARGLLRGLRRQRPAHGPGLLGRTGADNLVSRRVDSDLRYAMEKRLAHGRDSDSVSAARSQLPVLAAHVQVVSLVHVERDPRRSATHFFARLHTLHLEIDDGLTGAVHRRGLPGPGAIGEIAAVAIDLADRRHQIVEITLGALEDRIGVGAVLAPALLPALALVTQHPGGNHVFPLDASRSCRVLARLVAAACELHDMPDIVATAVEVILHAGKNFGQHLLGVGKIAVADRCLVVDQSRRRDGRRGPLRR
jgi:hypothetical protein